MLKKEKKLHTVFTALSIIIHSRVYGSITESHRHKERRKHDLCSRQSSLTSTVPNRMYFQQELVRAELLRRETSPESVALDSVSRWAAWHVEALPVDVRDAIRSSAQK
jgi:hypothetical protein